MSTRVSPNRGLIEVGRPHPEPRLVAEAAGPKKINALTLVDGKTFVSTTVAGDIVPPGAPEVGFFHDDTRFLSHMELRVGGQRAVVLSSNDERNFASQIELTTGGSMLRDSLDLPENTVHIRRQQFLAAPAFFDRLTFHNFNLAPVNFVVVLEYNADFVDVFQVRGCSRNVFGQHYEAQARKESLTFAYRGRDGLLRQTVVELHPAPTELRARCARWDLTLQPGASFQIEARITPQVEGAPAPRRHSDQSAALRQRRESYEEWERHSTRFHSSHDVFNAALETAAADLNSLQVRFGEERVLAAGIPWFATLFGRDSIIAAYQSLAVHPQLAVDTLRVLARHQGREHDDWRDEEPGKILHELRTGEMTRAGEMPFGPYYGALDSTPLFLVLLSETFNWTGDEELVRELLPTAGRALQWMEQCGDLDGDGLLEYSRRSPKGLVNQSWKDSWDANMHADGALARAPIAPIEVQGYAYDAKYRMALLLRLFGDAATAERLRREAAELAHRVDQAFWMPQHNFYAMALDGEKRPLQVISSNPGHLLFSRVISRERARAVAARLMQDDMFSGWGWRTISDRERIYNPLSYHRGSVWPHDNSLIAHGMALNEMRAEAMRCLTSLFHAALSFRDYRLPELFCGVHRREYDRPVQYPVSCSPQAWASGSMFLILASVLGIRPHARGKELNIVNPVLPEWLDYLHVRNLRVGRSRVGLEFARRGQRTYCNVVDVEGDRLQVNVVTRK